MKILSFHCERETAKMLTLSALTIVSFSSSVVAISKRKQLLNERYIHSYSSIHTMNGWTIIVVIFWYIRITHTHTFIWSSIERMPENRWWYDLCLNPSTKPYFREEDRFIFSLLLLIPSLGLLSSWPWWNSQSL